MDDKIKWVLLAVGGYFLYDWYSKQQPASTNQPVGGGAGTGAGTAIAPGGVYVQPTQPAPVDVPPVPVTLLPPWHAPVYTPPAVTPSQQAGLSQQPDAMIAQVAVSGAAGSDLAIAESVRRGQRYDFHVWNWYRELTLGEQPAPESYYGGNASDLVTAAEYMLVRNTAQVTGIVQGLTGLGRWGGPTLPWSTAWRA